MSKKIAYIRRGPIPIANERVAGILGESFQDFEVEIIEVFDLIKSRKDILFTNLFHLAKEYGPQILLDKAKIRRYFFSTPYIFEKIKVLISDRLANDDYIFSFQIQSLFDGSIEGLPHFVYTDHTALANLSYQAFNRREFYAESWLELEKTIYQNATLNFTRSTNISRSLIDEYGCDPNRVICVYAGNNDNSTNIDLNHNKYTSNNILFVGIDWNRKGGPELIEAFKTVLKIHPEVHLTIVGSSPAVKLPNCEVIGQIPIGEVAQYYEESSIFCLPTKREPFGVVFVEAMQHKLPIVATDIGAIPDFVKNGENGYLVKPGNVEQLANALINLIEQPNKCQAFGERGYQIAMEKYTWPKVGIRIKESILSANVVANGC